MTDWEKAYRYKAREWEVLPRSGAPQTSRLLRLWHKTDTLPMWLPDWLLDGLENAAARLCCLAHNHTPFTEMDGRTIVCAICCRTLGEHR